MSFNARKILLIDKRKQGAIENCINAALQKSPRHYDLICENDRESIAELLKNKQVMCCIVVADAHEDIDIIKMCDAQYRQYHLPYILISHEKLIHLLAKDHALIVPFYILENTLTNSVIVNAIELVVAMSFKKHIHAILMTHKIGLDQPLSKRQLTRLLNELAQDQNFYQSEIVLILGSFHFLNQTLTEQQQAQYETEILNDIFHEINGLIRANDISLQVEHRQFAIIAFNCRQSHDVIIIANRLINRMQRIENALIKDGKPVVKISIGLADTLSRSKVIKDLIDNAMEMRSQAEKTAKHSYFISR